MNASSTSKTGRLIEENAAISPAVMVSPNSAAHIPKALIQRTPIDKVDVAQDAALTHQEESEAQQTQQIKGTFWHSGNLWIVSEHLNTGNQRPDKREQKGKRSAIGNVFFKVTDTEMQKNNSAQSRHYNLKGSNNQGRKHNSGESGPRADSSDESHRLQSSKLPLKGKGHRAFWNLRWKKQNVSGLQ